MNESFLFQKVYRFEIVIKILNSSLIKGFEGGHKDEVATGFVLQVSKRKYRTHFINHRGN